MFSVWTPVQVSTKKHPRFEQAGTVFATNPDKPDESAVKFDTDGVVVVVENADLRQL